MNKTMHKVLNNIKLYMFFIRVLYSTFNVMRYQYRNNVILLSDWYEEYIKSADKIVHVSKYKIFNHKVFIIYGQDHDDVYIIRTRIISDKGDDILIKDNTVIAYDHINDLPVILDDIEIIALSLSIGVVKHYLDNKK